MDNKVNETKDINDINDIKEIEPIKTDVNEAVVEQDENLQAESKSEVHHRHHHHSHHGHHRHHSHHSHHKSKSKKSKLKRFMKKYKKELQIAAIVSLAIVFVVVAVLADRSMRQQEFQKESTATPNQNSIKSDYVYIGLPTFKNNIQLRKDFVEKYLTSDISVDINAMYDELDSNVVYRYDLPNAVELTFDVFHTPNSLEVKSAKVELSEDSSFKSTKFYDVDSSNIAKIYNLKTGAEYFYKAHFTMSDDRVLSYSGSFKTASGPRQMYIDGTFNVRDIGGWETTDGKIIKQGMLYRGNELDGAVEPTYKVTSKGATELVLALGVKTDMDLRASTDSVPGEYVLGKNVKHKYYDCVMYGAVFKAEGKKVIKEIFSDLAKPSNYPVYLHCTYGRDRTGTVCYLLEALLGVSEDDLIRDYELSAMYSGYINRDNIMKLHNGIMAYEGSTLKQKTENYLLSCGVTKAEIEAIRDIFLAE